jgi:hypothetical protein
VRERRKQEGLKRGKGEKMLRIGQKEVRVLEEDEVSNEARKEGLHVLSPVSKGRRGRSKVTHREKVVVLDVDEEGKVSSTVEEESEGDQPVPRVQPVQIGSGKISLVYHSKQQDRDWAGSGVMATVGLGESILSTQQRVEEVGYSNVEVISMGGDKVFLRSRNNEDVLHLFNEAIHFFGFLFIAVHKWTSTDTRYERSAWVRLYGIPIHAWNTNSSKYVLRIMVGLSGLMSAPLTEVE